MPSVKKTTAGKFSAKAASLTQPSSACLWKGSTRFGQTLKAGLVRFAAKHVNVLFARKLLNKHKTNGRMIKRSQRPKMINGETKKTPSNDRTQRTKKL
jgi:hypothetical protein